MDFCLYCDRDRRFCDFASGNLGSSFGVLAAIGLPCEVQFAEGTKRHNTKLYEQFERARAEHPGTLNYSACACPTPVQNSQRAESETFGRRAITRKEIASRFSKYRR